MRLLVVAPRYPIPVTEGHSLRVRHLLGNLPSAVRFTLVCESVEACGALPRDPEAALGPACAAVVTVPAGPPPERPEPRGIVRSVANVLFPDPLSPGYAIRPALRSEILSQVRTGEYDAIAFMGFSMFLQQDGLPKDLPQIVDMCDSYSVYCRNELRRKESLPARLRAFVNWIWAVRYEQRHCSRAPNLILITPADARSVQRHCPRSRTWALPNGVDCDYFHGGDTFGGGRGLLFTGVMDYAPNRDAMLHFIREVLPLVRAELPDTVLTIAGRNPAPELVEAARRDPGIRLTGSVEDIRPYFREAAVYVAPMVSGAGLKNKILEAWAMGKPVVATPLACSGLEVREGESVLIAGTPASFAREVVRVLRNRDLRARLASAGRRTAVQSYSWTHLARGFLAFIDEARRHPPGRVTGRAGPRTARSLPAAP